MAIDVQTLVGFGDRVRAWRERVVRKGRHTSDARATNSRFGRLRIERHHQCYFGAFADFGINRQFTVREFRAFFHIQQTERTELRVRFFDARDIKADAVVANAQRQRGRGLARADRNTFRLGVFFRVADRLLHNRKHSGFDFRRKPRGDRLGFEKHIRAAGFALPFDVDAQCREQTLGFERDRA